MSTPDLPQHDSPARPHARDRTRSQRLPGSATAEARPFGAHLQMSWWKPLVVLIVLPVSMLLFQIVLFQIAVAIEGDEVPPNTYTPLLLLAVNLSVGIVGLLAVPFVARLANVPWRAVLSFPRRFDRRRLGLYLGGSLVIIAGGNALLAVLAPESNTWTTFGVTSTTIVLLVVVVLTIPLQSLGEELMFRGAIMPAIASWVRPVGPALVFGIVASSSVFGLIHVADLWYTAYITFLGICYATVAVVSCGLEASIALHVANNTLTFILNVLFAGGGALILDRSVVSSGAHLLIPVPFYLAAVGCVWWYERRGRAAA